MLHHVVPTIPHVLLFNLRSWLYHSWEQWLITLVFNPCSALSTAITLPALCASGSFWIIPFIPSPQKSVCRIQYFLTLMIWSGISLFFAIRSSVFAVEYQTQVKMNRAHLSIKSRWAPLISFEREKMAPQGTLLHYRCGIRFKWMNGTSNANCRDAQLREQGLLCIPNPSLSYRNITSART